MTKVILVRHGQTRWNLEKRHQGHYDEPLTKKGLEQANQLAKRLACEPISAIYTSDLTRALTTAKCIAEKHNLSVSILPELREIDFGEWQGLSYEKIDNKLYTNPDELEIPGGETFYQAKERAMIALEKLVVSHYNQTIVVVSHGLIIRALLCTVLNIHLKHLWNIKQDNTAINMLEYHGNQVMASLINDAHHLVVNY